MADGTLPKADFSVFGPHGDRLSKKLKFASFKFGADTLGLGKSSRDHQIFRFGGSVFALIRHFCGCCG
eukprot:4049709-Amphidinium_carterae.3